MLPVRSANSTVNSRCDVEVLESGPLLLCVTLLPPISSDHKNKNMDLRNKEKRWGQFTFLLHCVTLDKICPPVCILPQWRFRQDAQPCCSLQLWLSVTPWSCSSHPEPVGRHFLEVTQGPRKLTPGLCVTQSQSRWLWGRQDTHSSSLLSFRTSRTAGRVWEGVKP